ncbi:YicC/YloC family endoribonuclease [Alkalibacillus haloalkaliphilus]|uniref:YicC/YloC family endoribonuclease n=1 Tax=Alkalibacillus haloalkaliphilus TaxID=94136 RepID=UPI0002E9605D|nr:YicC/YloC family endoribonuclease [Alkalibacillus haloalkaliphilus]
MKVGDDMVKSMTGYGQATQKLDELQLSVEVKTVNHRFLDFSFKMPRELMALEDRMKSQVKQYFERGRVDIFVNINGKTLTNQAIHVNWPLLNQYIDRVEEIKQHKNLSGQLDIEQLFQIEDAFVIEEENNFDSEVEQAILVALGEALSRVDRMRVDEGEALKTDVYQFAQEIEQLAKSLDQDKDKFKQNYYEKVTNRLKEFVADANVDENRLLQEIAILTDKGDITEEITRLLSHVEQVKSLLQQDGSIGRRLDFLTQELHREANTIGSKSNDVQVSKVTVDLKSVIEKIKEQVQNIE